MPVQKVLVTGANGFIGRKLCHVLAERGHEVIRAVRQMPLVKEEYARYAVIGDIDEPVDWAPILPGVEAVVHLAARAHKIDEVSTDNLDKYRLTNVHATIKLARDAAKAGVRRFVYISSIKVNGEQTRFGPFSESDTPNPQGSYAVSKWEAEQALHAVALETGMEIVIVRPPLVYGPEVGGNFLRLMSLVRKELPLPFGLVNNQRSLIFLDNFVDVLILCLAHPAAANKTFLVKDEEDISTRQLASLLAREMGKRSFLLPVPCSFMYAVGRMSGKLPEFQRLIGSLAIDDCAIRQELGWNPLYTIEEGIAQTSDWLKRSSG